MYRLRASTTEGPTLAPFAQSGIAMQPGRTPLAVLLALAAWLAVSCPAGAGVLQFRNRVPAGADNPNNIGSYTHTLEMRDDVGATTGYDAGLDVLLDTSAVPNGKFFVTYHDHNPQKTEYEFSPNLQVGDTYTTYLSFERNAGSTFTFTPNTIEFLTLDLSDNLHGVTDFAYELKVNSDNFGGYDVFRSGLVSEIIIQTTPELNSWNQLVIPGQDWRNGWKYGEITFTAVGTPTDADGNQDGKVDGSDFLLWQRGYGLTSGATPGDGDFNGDHAVNSTDLLIWQDQYGTSIPTTQAIPEPTSLTLAACLLFPLAIRGAYMGNLGQISRLWQDRNQSACQM